MKIRTSLIVLIFAIFPMLAIAQNQVVSDQVANDTVPTGRKGAMKWEEPKKEKLYFFSGFAVSADIVGFAMKAMGSRFSQMEIAGRLNIREKIFPIVELGVADAERAGNSKDNIFSCTAPYYRVGFDINANKKRKSNRLMVGARLGYSAFKYNFVGPSMTDPVWGETMPVNMTNIDASALWGEAILGFEAKIWSFFRVGWNLRYKFRFKQNHYEFGEPWYIPGYGPNGANCWGGTVNLIFDFGRTMKKGR